MDVTPLVSSDSQIIQGYAPGRFKISGQDYHDGVIVFPDRVESLKVTRFEDLSAESLQAFLAQAQHEIDVVLLGCGPKMEFVGGDLRQAFADKKLPLEPMDSGAACRTYNVLMAEGRRVAAILLPV